ncbi:MULTISPECIES: helix-turn-helix transcriptional regulator [unclassified Variovorax]|uniref:helix-turn-helix domain-containing protein n=1 Tax=unclassified Variovorax TaxID=663243 RepID=UPI0008386A82|nr:MULTISPECIES: helix-turn-helix transcriptional regulator [unclassified Variovorax]
MVARTQGDTTPLFGKRLREAREMAGIAQDKLGVLIGLEESSSSARISRYETGIHEPPVRTAKKIAVALKVPLAFLYCDDDVLAAIVLQAHRMSKEARRALLASMQAK